MPTAASIARASNVNLSAPLTLAQEPRFFLAYGGSSQRQTQLRVELPPNTFSISATTTGGRKVTVGASRGGGGDRFTTISFPGTFTKPNPRLAGFVPVGSNLPQTVSAPLKDGDPVNVTITDNLGRSATFALTWQGPDSFERENAARALEKKQDAYKNYPHTVWSDERGNRFVTVGDVTLAWGQRHLLERKLCENKQKHELAALESRVERAEEGLQAAQGYARYWMGRTGGAHTPLWVEERARHAAAGIRGAQESLAGAQAELQNVLQTRINSCSCDR